MYPNARLAFGTIAKQAFEQRLGILAGSVGPDFQVMALSCGTIATAYFAGEEGMSTQIKGLVFALLLVGVSAGAIAGSIKENRKLVESSLLVKGDIVIAPDGSVQAYTLTPNDAMKGLETFLDNNITHWRFKPVEVDGKAVTAKAPMSLRLVATPETSGNGMSVRIAGTWFGSSPDMAPTDKVRSQKMAPPKYPTGVMMVGGQGTVYLIVSAGRDGHVLNVEAERVNLMTLGTDRQMAEMREQFAKASILAAKRWTFIPPTTGPEAGKDRWSVRVPVAYLMQGSHQAHASKANGWESYIPDPSPKLIPWLDKEDQDKLASDALPDDGVYPLQQGAQLLTAPKT